MIASFPPFSLAGLTLHAWSAYWIVIKANNEPKPYFPSIIEYY
jgi:hypothetical protein